MQNRSNTGTTLAIGCVLIAGFFVVLTLLIAGAGIAYYTYITAIEAKNQVIQIHKNRLNVMGLRCLIIKAQQLSSQGALYHDLAYEKERQMVDRKIAAFQAELDTSIVIGVIGNRSTFPMQNVENLHKLMKEYNEFIQQDTIWYRVEEKLTEVTKERIEAEGAVIETLRTCIDSFTVALNESQVTDETIKDTAYVHKGLAQQVQELQMFMIKFGDLRRNYVQIMNETDPPTQRKQCMILLVDTEKLFADLREFSITVSDLERRKRVEDVIAAFEVWGKTIKQSMECLDIQAEAVADRDRISADMAKTLMEMSELMERLAADLERR